MITYSSDITTALLAQLKALRDKHLQFQARVKSADQAVRERDEETRTQITILTERIVTLEKELEQAKNWIEVRASINSYIFSHLSVMIVIWED